MYTVSKQDQVLAKQGIFTHQGIRDAYDAHSPRLAEFICKLLILDPAPRQMFIEERRGTPTFASFVKQLQRSVSEQRTLLYHLPENHRARQTPTGRLSPVYTASYIWQGHKRVWDHLTSEVMSPLLPERVRLYEVIVDLWNDSSIYARTQLIDILKFARFKYGVWKAFKQIFKEAEIRYDWEVYAILNDRFHNNGYSWYAAGPQYIVITDEDQAVKEAEMAVIRNQETQQETLESSLNALLEMDSLTPEQEAEMVALEDQIEGQRASIQEAYRNARLEPNVINWSSIRDYRSADGDYRFERFPADPSQRTLNYLQRRARRTFRHLAADFPEAFPGAAVELLMSTHSNTMASRFVKEKRALWLQQQTPLLKVVEESRNPSHVRWAYDFLVEDFRLEMKEVSPEWLYRVSQSTVEGTAELALDYLENVTGVGEGEFYAKGYHKTIIGFLGINTRTQSSEAVDFAISYLQSAMANEDNTWLIDALPLQMVARLLRAGGRLNELGMHLLQGNEQESPYESAFNLDFFTTLLHDYDTFQFASKEIRRRYTGLSPEWFTEVLLSGNWQARQFATTLLKDSTMIESDVDWSEFAKDLLVAVDAESHVYNAAWVRLTSGPADQIKPIQDRSKVAIDFIRFMFVHPQELVRSYALMAVKNGFCTVGELGVNFLKSIATPREYKATLEKSSPWSNEMGELMYETLVAYLQDNDGSVYSVENGEAIRQWLSIKDNFTLNDLGLEWVFERLQWWSPQYNFVRDVFSRDVTMSELSTLMPPLSKPEFESESSIINGARQVAWYVYHRCFDAGSQKANFFKKLLLERNASYRLHKGLPPLNSEMIWPSEAFDFAWFKRWATSKREPIRAYAIQMSRYEMSHWIESGNIGFNHLRPLVTGFFDVQQAIVRAIYKPLTPVNNSRIDVGLASFTPSDLYLYCFGSNDQEVDFALQLIVVRSDQFGQPSDLLSLSDSSTPKVRQVVINVLWELYKTPETSYDWKPFPYSVVPYSMSAAIDPTREASVDPNTLTGDAAKFGKAKHFLGLGSSTEPVRASLSEDNQFDLNEFLRRILYTLPRNPDVLTPEEKARKAKITAKGGAQNTVTVQSSWRNKKTLVAAIRDLAIRDREFAEFVLPVLQEFSSVRSKMLHNACLTALTQIRVHHQLS